MLNRRRPSAPRPPAAESEAVRFGREGEEAAAEEKPKKTTARKKTAKKAEEEEASVDEGKAEE